MKRMWKRDQRGQLHVVEAIIVGVLVFTILFVTSVFRLPTSASTFQQAELAGLADDTLVALLAKPPGVNAECNEDGFDCPFESELERMLSLALGYQGEHFVALDEPDTDEIVEYLVQALPPGTRYIMSFSNGVTTTTIYPEDLVPPALDVSVGHLFMSFQWDEFADEVDQSMLMRIDEPTGFKTAEVVSIRDPLNRIENQDSETMLTLFVNATGTQAVPEDVVYGTYEICRAVADCTHFTVAPPGVFGAGSSILSKDRDNTTSLNGAGTFTSRVRYADTGVAGFDRDDPLYLDFTTLDSVSEGDLRLTAVGDDLSPCRSGGACAAGTRVEDTDSDTLDALLPLATVWVRAAQTGSSATELEEGEAVYLDADLSSAISDGDRRLTRVGTYAFGSVVTTGDADIGPALSAFTTETVVWGNLDGGAGVDIDLGEAVYLDLDGHGQSSGLEALDIHLSPKGSPTARFVYDVRLVVWYGI